MRRSAKVPSSAAVHTNGTPRASAGPDREFIVTEVGFWEEIAMSVEPVSTE